MLWLDLDYLVPIESEAQTITILAACCKQHRRSKEIARSAYELAAFIVVIITLGEKNAFLSAEGMGRASTFLRLQSIALWIPRGAGDAFIGSFANFLEEGIPEREAIRRRESGRAALSTTSIGTQKSFCNRAQ